MRTLILVVVMLALVWLIAEAIAAVIPFLFGLALLWYIVVTIHRWLVRKDGGPSA